MKGQVRPESIVTAGRGTPTSTLQSMPVLVIPLVTGHDTQQVAQQRKQHLLLPAAMLHRLHLTCHAVHLTLPLMMMPMITPNSPNALRAARTTCMCLQQQRPVVVAVTCQKSPPPGSSQTMCCSVHLRVHSCCLRCQHTCCGYSRRAESTMNIMQCRPCCCKGACVV